MSRGNLARVHSQLVQFLQAYRVEPLRPVRLGLEWLRGVSRCIAGRRHALGCSSSSGVPTQHSRLALPLLTIKFEQGHGRSWAVHNH